MCLWRPSRPWIVPSVEPIELFFFKRVFRAMCQQSRMQNEASRLLPDVDQCEEQEVALVEFQRAMVRFFRIIRDGRHFDVMEYDANRNGNVGWYEFCSLWKERQIIVRLSIAERIFLTLEDAQRSIAGTLVSSMVFLSIIVSSGCFILSTLPESQDRCALAGTPGYDPSCRPTPKDIFKTIDLACTIFFTTEYVMRIITSAFTRTELIDRDRAQLLQWMISDDIITVPTPSVRIATWACNFTNVIDLVSVLPGYMSVAMGEGGSSPMVDIIRIMRVIRAFRLGRHLEAVIIIMRSLRRSVRALGVLICNLFLGIVIFASLMYFAEQGTWDSNTQAYLRWEGVQFNSTSLAWEPVYGRSPFDSIPACFWWAIVTATTVGYGDLHTPRTAAGKVVSAVFMVWSLCVLALPIGVIGGNFSQVYQEYDHEKQNADEMRAQEEMMLKRSRDFGDPLNHSKRLLIEVWHDSGLGSNSEADELQSEFLGEVDYTLELSQKEPLRRVVREPLGCNVDKARRKVRGHLVFEYNWMPNAKGLAKELLVGKLEVVVVKAENVLGVDWKGSGKADPYCVVIVHPRSPDKDGVITEIQQRSKTAWDTFNPVWNSLCTFQFSWIKSDSDVAMADLLGTDVRRSVVSCSHAATAVTAPTMTSIVPDGGDVPIASSRRKDLGLDLLEELDEINEGSNRHVLSENDSDRKPSNSPSGANRSRTTATMPDKEAAKTEKLLQRKPEAKVELLRAIVPELQGEIDKLKAIVPQIQQEMLGVREDLQLIMETLRNRGPGAVLGQLPAPPPDNWSRSVSWA